MIVQELLETKDIPYRISGGDFLVRCFNPEHEDRNPSMRIDQILGIYNCLSCGFKGNIFRYFDEPADLLAQKREKLKRKIMEIRAMSIGLDFPKDYTPYIGNWRNIKPETYKKFEAFRSHWPEFAGRIVFPIRNITGNIVVFQGRDELGTQERKYMNFPRGVPLPMFPQVTPKKGAVIIVEGIFDMLNLHDKGLNNAVCIFGVNQFNGAKAGMLKMQGVQTLDIILDPDDAGEEGSKEIKKIAEAAGLHSRIVTSPGSADPGSLTEAQIKALRRRLYDE